MTLTNVKTFITSLVAIAFIWASHYLNVEDLLTEVGLTRQIVIDTLVFFALIFLRVGVLKIQKTQGGPK